MKTLCTYVKKKNEDSGSWYVHAAVSGGAPQAEFGQLHLWIAPGPVPSSGGRASSSHRVSTRTSSMAVVSHVYYQISARWHSLRHALVLMLNARCFFQYFF